MDMGNVIIGDIIPRVDNGINGIILFIILMLMCFGVLEITLLSHIFSRAIKYSFIIGEKR